jgi:nitrous oxide reductase accessory protein NosL
MMTGIRSGAAAALLLLFATAAFAQDDIARHRFCGECGMDRKAYGFSRMLIVYDDGAEVGTCSLHCTAAALGKAPGKTAKSILAADRDRTELVDAEKATWVMGGKKRGVMTAVPKWAFGAKDAAEAFVKAQGGKIVPWAEALEAARQEVR